MSSVHDEKYKYINIYFRLIFFLKKIKNTKFFMPLKSPLYEIYQYKLNYDNWENFQHNGIRQKKCKLVEVPQLKC